MSTERTHPKGLFVLLWAEAFERFAFFTLVFLLVLYLTQEVELSQSSADQIFGTFMSFVYVMTVIAGVLASRWIGYRRAVIIGGVFATAGFALLVSGTALYFALAMVIWGVALFKVNVTSMVGQLYQHENTARDSGFSLFYIGINVGGFAATLGSGWVASTLGYTWAFAFAGIGAFIAVAIIVLGQRFLPTETPKRPSQMSQGLVSANTMTIVGVVVAAMFIAALFRTPVLATITLVSITTISVAYFFFEMVRCERSERQGFAALVILFSFAVVFWAVYGQSGVSILLFIDSEVNREIAGQTTISPPGFASLNPVFVLLTAPFFAWLWLRLARAHLEPNIAAKFVLGLLFLGSAFFVLALGRAATPEGSLLSPIWMVGFFLLITCGEMCVSPVGLSTVSRLMPARLLGFGMGMWFLAEAVAYYLAGTIAKFAAAPAGASAQQVSADYERAFLGYGTLAVIGGIGLLPFVMLIGYWLTPSRSQRTSDT